MIFDTHSHYNDKQYTQDREAVLASLKDAGVTQVVNVSARLERFAGYVRAYSEGSVYVWGSRNSSGSCWRVE